MAYDKWPPKSRRLSEEARRAIVSEVRENIEDCCNFERQNRLEAELDLKFLAGDQWSDAAKAIRGTTRPMLTINQLPQFVRQVTNPMREADIAIKASPVDDSSDPKLAKIYNGLIKQIEYQSTAKAVYVWGNEQQANCGIGWWQVCTEYVDDAVFEQEIRIKRIENPLAVYMDPGAREPDGSDAMWAAVVENWPRKTFKRRYPEASESSVDVPDIAHRVGFQWSANDVVTVAMYYRKVPAKKVLAQLQSGPVIEITGKGEAELGQIDANDPIVAVRECESYRVEKYLVTGADVLEGPIAWLGKYIPLVRVLGAEIPGKSGTLRYGVVRFARDPQQMLNFSRTAAAEAIAMAPKTPWLVTGEMIGPYKAEWDAINRTNAPYLRYKSDPTATATGGAPKRESGPEIPAALLQQAEVAAEDMKRVTGIYEASLGQRSNETSGVAISRRQAEGDTANAHFSDNMVQALVYTGRILLDLIPKIYDNERVVRLLDEHGREDEVPINAIEVDDDGLPHLVNDLSVARFDVRVTVGKSYVTKRIEALNAMLEFAKALPPQAQLLFLDLIAKNSDWPGSEELAKRFRSLVPAEALADPNDPDAPKPPQPQDDPMFVANLERLAAEIEETRAKARKADADARKALVEAGAIGTETDMAVQQQIMNDWQAGNPNPGEPPPEGMPPPAPGGGQEPSFAGGSLGA